MRLRALQQIMLPHYSDCRQYRYRAQSPLVLTDFRNDCLGSSIHFASQNTQGERVNFMRK